MTETKERLYRVFLQAPGDFPDEPEELGDGRIRSAHPNRTIELMAASPDKARRIAERQADDIAEAYGEPAYEVKSVEAVK